MSVQHKREQKRFLKVEKEASTQKSFSSRKKMSNHQTRPKNILRPIPTLATSISTWDAAHCLHVLFDDPGSETIIKQLATKYGMERCTVKQAIASRLKRLILPQSQAQTNQSPPPVPPMILSVINAQAHLIAQLRPDFQTQIPLPNNTQSVNQIHHLASRHVQHILNCIQTRALENTDCTKSSS
jgi:hypothetical protein